jgi:hypothetical protein
MVGSNTCMTHWSLLILFEDIFQRCLLWIQNTPADKIPTPTATAVTKCCYVHSHACTSWVASVAVGIIPLHAEPATSSCPMFMTFNLHLTVSCEMAWVPMHWHSHATVSNTKILITVLTTAQMKQFHSHRSTCNHRAAYWLQTTDTNTTPENFTHATHYTLVLAHRKLLKCPSYTWVWMYTHTHSFWLLVTQK